MIRFTVYSFLLMMLPMGLLAQEWKVQGLVLEASDSSANGGVEVRGIGFAPVLTKANGSFILNAKGEIPKVLHFYKENYTVLTIALSDTGVLEPVYLSQLYLNLDVVKIKAQQAEAAKRNFNAVESTYIYASRKTELVQVAKLNSDLGANNARQIFAQVSGLNIYEGSEGGLQLNVGGRGLDPNRSSNFNVRQNGYDISADVLGYPESYYTPPPEAINEIQVVKGAASLQFGTQFGGLLQFQLKEAPTDTGLAIELSQSLGSFGRYSSYLSLGAKKGKWTYFGYFNYREGQGWRPNSAYSSRNVFAAVSYQAKPKHKLSLEYSYFNYLAKQPGGLSDFQFNKDPTFSNRSRNWFQVNWQLYALKHNWTINAQQEISTQLFALNAGRNALGFRGLPQVFNVNPILSIDEQDQAGNFLNPRDLITGRFRNAGIETRWINRYQAEAYKGVMLAGLKYYHAFNESRQGAGSKGIDADFTYSNDRFPDYANQSSFEFPNRNLAFFSEHIFFLNEKWSVTPGLRTEQIFTGSRGSYQNVIFDNAGNLIFRDTLIDNRDFSRAFVIGGIGASYRPKKDLEWYTNLSQNYRSVTFSDIRTVNPTFIVDPGISDEKGFTTDLGFRGSILNWTIDASVFSMLYGNRIGIVLNNRAQRVRKNIGGAFIYGTEVFVRRTWVSELNKNEIKGDFYLNLALTSSQYLANEEASIAGNKVEFIPLANLKTGLDVSFQKWQLGFQFSSVGEQFTDAENSGTPGQGDLREGSIGQIPAYAVMDLSLAYQWRYYTLGMGLHNLGNAQYFTRRATGYPGPGIIPSDPFNFSFFLKILL